jgi:hypothetical protein
MIATPPVGGCFAKRIPGTKSPAQRGQVSIDLNRFLRSEGELIEAPRLTAINTRLLAEPETMLCGTTLFEF